MGMPGAATTLGCALSLSPVHWRYRKSAMPTPRPVVMCSATARSDMNWNMSLPACLGVSPDSGTDDRMAPSIFSRKIASNCRAAVASWASSRRLAPVAP